jgi:hypothetical protein
MLKVSPLKAAPVNRQTDAPRRLSRTPRRVFRQPCQIRIAGHIDTLDRRISHRPQRLGRFPLVDFGMTIGEGDAAGIVVVS